MPVQVEEAVTARKAKGRRERHRSGTKATPWPRLYSGVSVAAVVSALLLLVLAAGPAESAQLSSSSSSSSSLAAGALQGKDSLVVVDTLEGGISSRTHDRAGAGQNLLRRRRRRGGARYPKGEADFIAKEEAALANWTSKLAELQFDSDNKASLDVKTVLDDEIAQMRGDQAAARQQLDLVKQDVKGDLWWPLAQGIDKLNNKTSDTLASLSERKEKSALAKNHFVRKNITAAEDAALDAFEADQDKALDAEDAQAEASLADRRGKAKAASDARVAAAAALRKFELTKEGAVEKKMAAQALRRAEEKKKDEAKANAEGAEKKAKEEAKKEAARAARASMLGEEADKQKAKLKAQEEAEKKAEAAAAASQAAVMAKRAAAKAATAARVAKELAAQKAQEQAAQKALSAKLAAANAAEDAALTAKKAEEEKKLAEQKKLLAAAFEAYQCKWVDEGPPASLGPGEWQSAPPTESSNRVCERLTVCNYTAEFTSKDHTRTSDRKCTPLTVCEANEWQSVNETVRSDRTCQKHTVCKFPQDEEYESGPGTRFADRVCRPMRKCVARRGPGKDKGEGDPTYGVELTTPTLTAAMSSQDGGGHAAGRALVGDDRDDNGNYAQTGGQQADPWWRVDLGEVVPVGMVRVTQLRGGSASSSASSIDLRGWEVRTGVSADVAAVEAVKRRGAKDSDPTRCGGGGGGGGGPNGHLSPKGDGYGDGERFGSALGAGKTKDVDCAGRPGRYVFVRVKGRGRAALQLARVRVYRFGSNLYEFESKAPTPTSNRQCAVAADCKALGLPADGGEWQEAAPGKTDDRTCTKVTECDPDTEWEAASPTATTDRACKTATVCTEDQYEKVPLTKYADRECATAKKCDPKLEYESKPQTRTSDRECAAVTLCKPGLEFEVSANTTTADRKCKAKTPCDPLKEYETRAPTDTADRQCKAATACKAQEWERTALSPRADRECDKLTTCDPKGSPPQVTISEPAGDTYRLCAREELCLRGAAGLVAALAPAVGGVKTQSQGGDPDEVYAPTANSNEWAAVGKKNTCAAVKGPGWGASKASKPERAWAVCCRNAPRRHWKDGSIVHLRSSSSQNRAMYLSSCLGDGGAFLPAKAGQCNAGADLEASTQADLRACKRRCGELARCRGVNWRASDRRCVAKDAVCATAVSGDHVFHPRDPAWQPPMLGGCPVSAGGKDADAEGQSEKGLDACKARCLELPGCVGVEMDPSGEKCTPKKKRCDAQSAEDEAFLKKAAASPEEAEQLKARAVYHGMADFGKARWLPAPDAERTAWRVRLVDGDLRNGGKVLLETACKGVGAGKAGTDDGPRCLRNDRPAGLAGAGFLLSDSDLAKPPEAPARDDNARCASREEILAYPKAARWKVFDDPACAGAKSPNPNKFCLLPKDKAIPPQDAPPCTRKVSDRVATLALGKGTGGRCVWRLGFDGDLTADTSVALQAAAGAGARSGHYDGSPTMFTDAQAGAGAACGKFSSSQGNCFEPRGGHTLWNNRNYAWRGAPGGLLTGGENWVYQRVNLNGGPVGGREGGFDGTLKKPAKVAVCLANHCGRTNVPDDAYQSLRWSKISGSGYAISNHGGSPCTFWQADAQAGRLRVSGSGCWASGLFFNFDHMPASAETEYKLPNGFPVLLTGWDRRRGAEGFARAAGGTAKATVHGLVPAATYAYRVYQRCNGGGQCNVNALSINGAGKPDTNARAADDKPTATGLAVADAGGRLVFDFGKKRSRVHLNGLAVMQPYWPSTEGDGKGLMAWTSDRAAAGGDRGGWQLLGADDADDENEFQSKVWAQIKPTDSWADAKAVCEGRTSATPTRDRQCEELLQCEDDEYETQAPTPTKQRKCAKLTECRGDEFEEVAATKTSDRTCKALTICTGNEFEEEAPTETSDRKCGGMRECEGEEWEVSPPTPVKNRVCKKWTKCNETSYETKAPGSKNDRECDLMTVCAWNQYESKAPTKTTDRECTKTTVCDEEKQYEARAPTSRLDRKCNKLTVCNSDQWEEVPPMPNADRVCKTTTKCNDNHRADSRTEYEVSPPSEFEDRVCAKVKVCSSAEHETKAATKTEDRECAKTTVCPKADACETCKGTWSRVKATRTSDAVCAPWTTCEAHQFPSRAPSQHRDRVCSTAAKCDYRRQFEMSPPSNGRNRQCRNTKTCASNEYQTRAPTKTADRVCTRHTQCNYGREFQKVAPTSTRDRVCQAHTQCKGSGREWKVKDPTRTADRQCKACSTCDPNYEVEFMGCSANRDRDCAVLPYGANCLRRVSETGYVGSFSRDDRWRDMHNLARTETVDLQKSLVLVQYQYSGKGPGNGQTFAMRLLVDNAEKPEARAVGSGSYQTLSGFWVGELRKGRHSFRAQYRSKRGVNFPSRGSNYAVRNLQVTRLPAGSAVLAAKRATAATTLEGSNQWREFPGLSAQFDLDSTHVVGARYQISHEVADNNYLVTRVMVDGREQRETRATTGGGGGGRYNTNRGEWYGSLGKGSHTVKVFYRTGQPSAQRRAFPGGSDDWRGGSLQVLKFPSSSDKGMVVAGNRAIHTGNWNMASDSRYRDAPGMAASIRINQYSVILARFSMSTRFGGGYVAARLLLNNGELKGTRSIGGDLSYGLVDGTYVARLAPGSYTFKVQYRANRGNNMNAGGTDFMGQGLVLLDLGTRYARKFPSLNYRHGWRSLNNPYNYPSTSVSSDDSFCVVHGSEWAGPWGRHNGAYADASCRPPQRLIFNSMQDGHANARVDMTTDGNFHWITSNRGHHGSWYSLSGFIFSKAGSPFKDITMYHGWRHYGSSYGKAQYVASGGMCVVQGMMRGSHWGHIGNFPGDCRPKKRLMFNLNNHQYPLRIDVRHDGHFYYQGGHRRHNWLSLSGIAFALKNQRGLQMHNGWRCHGGEWQCPTYAVNNGICIVEGLGHTRWNRWGHIATLPSECRPGRRLIYNMNNHYGWARVDVLTNGQIHYINGNRDHRWLSFSGIQFAVQ
eukprot:g266.t1